MSNTIEVNRPSYDMEPDPPRFTVGKLVKYAVIAGVLLGAFSYRDVIVDRAKEFASTFEEGSDKEAGSKDVQAEPVEVVLADMPIDGDAPAVPMVARSGPVPAPPSPPPVQPPVPEAGAARWLTADSIPAKHILYPNGGALGFALEVDRAGRVFNCQVAERPATEYEELVEVTVDMACDRLKKSGRFRPATDSRGEPTEGSYIYTLRLPPQR